MDLESPHPGTDPRLSSQMILELLFKLLQLPHLQNDHRTSSYLILLFIRIIEMLSEKYL